jgi:type I restriction enzyme S subunit
MIRHELERYSEYKETNSMWFVQAPIHWKSGRLKDFLDSSTITNIPSSLNEDDLIEFIPMTNINEEFGTVRNFNMVPLREVSSGYTKFRNGDVIFAKITPCMENGNCAIVNGLTHNVCFGSTEFIVFRALRKLQEKYLHYFLHNYLFRRNAEPFMKGTAGQKRISSQYMMTHYFALPPVNEQQIITNYIDAKTNQIDRKIDLLIQKVAKYDNLKKSLINEIITRGLDKTVKLKDSGVEWIGNVPEHWVPKRICDLFLLVNKTVSTDMMKDREVFHYSIPIVQQTGTGQMEDGSDIDSNKSSISGNELLFSKLNPRKETICITSKKDSDILMVASGEFLVLKALKNKMFLKYGYYLLSANINKEKICSTVKSVTKSHLRANPFDIFKMSQLVPSYEEQQDIANYLDVKTAQLECVIGTINTQIDKLKELRKALINDVITGKIKVTSIGDEEAI